MADDQVSEEGQVEETPVVETGEVKDEAEGPVAAEGQSDQ